MSVPKTSFQRSLLMGRVRQEGTSAELVVRDLLTNRGHSFETNGRDLPGSPDIYDSRRKLALFVHGCFWHRHKNCRAATVPKSNAQFWKRKFTENTKRDFSKSGQLRSLGYRVFTVWECQVKTQDRIEALTERLTKIWGENCLSGHRTSSENIQEKRIGLGEPLQKVLGVTEKFHLVQKNRVIVREILRRDGSSSSTQISLARPLPVHHVSQENLAQLTDISFLQSKKRPMFSPGHREIRVVDLYSGCGLMTLGAWEACRALGYKMVSAYAMDINPHAIEVYKNNFPGANAVCRDIREILDSHLNEMPSPSEMVLKESLGQVDLLVGGPPCQGHSDLNNHTRRSDPKNRLYERMARFAEVIRPTSIIIENVPAVAHDIGKAVDVTATQLKRLGYSVSCGIVDAGKLGVPQTRKRHILVASLLREISLVEMIQHHTRSVRTVGWAIADLAKKSGAGILDKPSKSSPSNLKRINYLFDNQLFDLPDSKRPDCHRFKQHSYKSVYGRLHWDKPAQTITSGFTCCGQGRFIHPRRRRTLTPHEAARLQFIPDFFELGEHIPRSSTTELIGNAVPMKLAYVLALELLR